MRSVVVLPAPFGPSSPSTCPAWQTRSTPSTTSRPPRRLTSACASRRVDIRIILQTDGRLGGPSEAVAAPVFAAHAVTNEKQTVGIVLLLDREQLRVVESPVRSLPIREEVVTLGHIGGAVRRDPCELLPSL